jgi:hypothetical protein
MEVGSFSPRIGDEYQAVIEEEDHRRSSSPPRLHTPSLPMSATRRSTLLPDPDSKPTGAASVAPSTAVKLTRKCGTPHCTLPDFHDGPCSCAMVSGGRRTARQQAPEPVQAEAMPRAVHREQHRLSTLVGKRGSEPPWKLDAPKQDKRRATSQRRPTVSLNAAERREAGQGAACLRGWTDVEKDLFALGIMLYGRDMRAIRQLLPARKLPELIEFYYLKPPLAATGSVAVASAAVSADPVGSLACSECKGPLAEPVVRCTASAGCPHATCLRCHDSPQDARAHGHFWLCAPCTSRLRAAHQALLSPAHAACISCGSVKPTTLLDSNPWVRGLPTCSECLARFAVPVACMEAAAFGADTADASFCCQWCSGRDGRVAYTCSAEGCPHSVCARCIVRCLGQERVDELAADKEDRFLCALHDPSLKCAATRWTRQGLE